MVNSARSSGLKPQVNVRSVADFTSAPTLIGESVAFQCVLTLVSKVADCVAPVLIQGETGTGKELIARAVHYGGARRNQPFIPVNCGAIPESLFESQIFGHRKGAFTDAKSDQPGLVDLAYQGTLFLDEIDALCPKSQVALLRFLQDQRYRPVGGSRERGADVRIVAASNADLQTLAVAGQFRWDLLYRLNVLTVTLPPLRERKGDVRLLAEYFVQHYGAQATTLLKGIDDDTLAWFDTYSWPGNIRELENLVYRGVILNESSVIHIEPLRTSTSERRILTDRRRNVSDGLSFQAAKQQVLITFEQRYLKSVLTQTHGNVTQAAQLAKKERRALGKLLKKYHIDPSHFRRH
jgi:two-component system response regulator GlrR